MWPFKKKLKCTSEEFATYLMEMIKYSAKDCCTHLWEHAEENWALESDEQDTLFSEMIIAHLWMVSHTFGSNKLILNLLHDDYLSILCNPNMTKEDATTRILAAQSELVERYKQYYKAWDESEQKNNFLPVAFAMSQFFFPKHKPVLDVILQFNIATYLTAFTESVFKAWEKCKIVDT